MSKLCLRWCRATESSLSHSHTSFPKSKTRQARQKDPYQTSGGECRLRCISLLWLCCWRLQSCMSSLRMNTKQAFQKHHRQTVVNVRFTLVPWWSQTIIRLQKVSNRRLDLCCTGNVRLRKVGTFLFDFQDDVYIPFERVEIWFWKLSISKDSEAAVFVQTKDNIWKNLFIGALLLCTNSILRWGCMIGSNMHSGPWSFSWRSCWGPFVTISSWPLVRNQVSLIPDE